MYDVWQQRRQDLRKALDKYLLIKEIYIECEETDPELKSNLQPLNEFRAALDHLFRIIDINIANEQTPENEERFRSQYSKLNGHLCRAFFDVCDHLVINYRNKISAFLGVYSPDAIQKAFPNYYSTIRPSIEKISLNIARYRVEKGTRDDNELFDEYKRDVDTMREHYLIITDASTSPSLNAIRQYEKKQSLTNIGLAILGIIIGICGLLFGLLK